MSSREFEVNLFTDGACSGNPGPGGWAYILRHVPSGKESECSGGNAESTNNRMELQAVVEGLTALKRPCRVEIFTDSVYVGKGMTEWMIRWKANGWMRQETTRESKDTADILKTNGVMNWRWKRVPSSNKVCGLVGWSNN